MKRAIWGIVTIMNGAIWGNLCQKSIPGDGSLYSASSDEYRDSSVTPTSVMPREELMNALASSREPSSFVSRLAPCPSPAPRSQSAALTVSALLATPHPQPSPCAARNSHSSPLAASPNNFRPIRVSIHLQVRRCGGGGEARFAWKWGMRPTRYLPASVARRTPSPLGHRERTKGAANQGHVLSTWAARTRVYAWYTSPTAWLQEDKTSAETGTGYRGTSLRRNSPPLGPYSRPMRRALGWS